MTAPGREATDDSERGAWLCVEETTRPEWLDENGHVNVQYYLQLVARAMHELMERTLQGGARPEPAPLFFALEIRISYRAELMAGQRVRVYVRPLARSAKTVRVLVRIVRVDPPALSAECEWKGGFVDRESRRVQPPSEGAGAIFDAKMSENTEPPYETPVYPAGLTLPPPAPGTEIISAQGEVEPAWIDRMGHMGIEHYMLIFNRAAGGYFNALGFDREAMRTNGWGAFGMESHIRYLRELKLGERFVVKTAAHSLRRKTATYRHTIYLKEDSGGAPVICATCDHTSLFVDWTTRRSIPLPQLFKDKISGLHGISVPAEI